MAILTPAQKVAAYIKIRDFKKTAEDEFKKSMEDVHKALEKLEAELLDHLNTTGTNSLSCDDGTAYRNNQISATVENRAAFKAFCEEHNFDEAMDIKANKTFIKEFMDKNKAVPPGVKVTQMATVGVRRGKDS